MLFVTSTTGFAIFCFGRVRIHWTVTGKFDGVPLQSSTHHLQANPCAGMEDPH